MCPFLWKHEVVVGVNILQDNVQVPEKSFVFSCKIETCRGYTTKITMRAQFPFKLCEPSLTALSITKCTNSVNV